jgi:hypothetical protein
MRAALLLIATFCRHQLAAATSPCESLASVAVPNGMITLAETVAAGAFKPPANGRAADGGRTPDYSGLPAFCRVQASLKPSADSDIRVEVWMPASTSWNSKFLGLAGRKRQTPAEERPAFSYE